MSNKEDSCEKENGELYMRILKLEEKLEDARETIEDLHTEFFRRERLTNDFAHIIGEYQDWFSERKKILPAYKMKGKD